MQEAWKRALVQFLASFWRRTDWKKMARHHYAHDIFEHRVQVASTQPNFRRVAEKLCETLSFQYPPVHPSLIDILDQHPDALQSLRREVRYWVSLAVTSKEVWQHDSALGLHGDAGVPSPSWGE